jgi:eukaryotic-like serine/threonine-protein kinase
MPPSTPPTPSHLADFEIVRRLGSGGMAEVFLAKKRGAEQTFKLQVVKRILPAHGASPRFRAMFAVEAQLATRLNHPNIVQVYDFQDYSDEGLLLSMEYVEGPDLRRVHKATKTRNTRLSPYVAAYIIGEVAKGLHYAHERTDESGRPLNIVHRDVSPQNILISYEGSVKVADFGIATATLFRQEAGLLKGKTAYMSPEQARGDEVDRRSDIYSLGIVFHELLTGKWLYDSADDKNLLEAVRLGQVEPPSTFVRGVPAELESIVMRALSVERDNRFATARDFASAIARVLFQKQQLIDAQTIEGVVSELIPREPAEDFSHSDMPHFGGDEPPSYNKDDSNPSGINSLQTRNPEARAGREVRHVTLVHMRIHGRAELEEKLGKGATSRVVDRVHQVLSNIAYRAGTRWIWDDEQTDRNQTVLMLGSAYAVVGVMPNPSGAANNAARLALDVHDALEAACEELPTPLRASVAVVRGVAEGRRDRGGHLIEYRLHNPARLISEKLVEATPPERTWVAGGVYRLVRRDFVWSDAPSLALGGVHSRAPASMRVYALERPRSREEKHAEGSLSHRALVGRDSELAELHAAFHQCVSSLSVSGASVTGQLVARLVTGELGIGKTALANAFLGELPPHARELRVECSPYQTEIPFSNAAQWLRTLTDIKPEESIEQARSAILDVLGDLSHEDHTDEVVRRMSELATGHFAEAADEADAVRHRRLLAAGLRHLLARAAQKSPLVLMIDGLQWIDQPSLELLATLVRRSDAFNHPLLIVLLSRHEERILPYVDGMVRVELGNLSHANQLHLVEAHVGVRRGVAEACADIFPRTGGNPFFLLEMVDALLERGALEVFQDPVSGPMLVRHDNPENQQLALPSTLEQLIGDRINELAAPEKAVIEWLAVSGGPLPQIELPALLNATVAPNIPHLVARGLCVANHDYVDVKHPLTRDVTYAALSLADRSHMHQQLGERLAQNTASTGLNAAIVARHLALGEQPESAAPYYIEAAGTARAAYQLPLAARYFRRALETLPSGDARRLKVYLSLEEIYRVQGKWNERTRYLAALREQALSSSSGYWVATALLRSARYDYDTGHLTRALGVARMAEATAQEAQVPTLQTQVQSLSAEILRDLGDMQGALAACERALQSASHLDVAPRLRAEVLRAQATLLLRVGRIDAAVTAHAEAIAVFRHAGARRHEARAKSSLAYAMYVRGRFEDAIALALDAIRIDLAIGGRFQIAKTLSNIAQCYRQLGDVERSRNYFQRALLAHERYEDPDSHADTLLSNAELLLETGQTEDATKVIEEAESLSGYVNSSYDAVHAKLLRAEVARRMGNSSMAVVYAFDARQVAETQAYASLNFYAMALEARARVEIGEVHTASLLASTTLSAIENLEGSEYALETRVLCLEALQATQAAQFSVLQLRAAKFVADLAKNLRSAQLRQMFLARHLVQALYQEALTG